MELVEVFQVICIYVVLSFDELLKLLLALLEGFQCYDFFLAKIFKAYLVSILMPSFQLASERCQPLQLHFFLCFCPVSLFRLCQRCRF